MGKVALICGEPIRATMAGIGLRYHAFATHLPRHGLEVALIHPGDPAEVPALPETGAVSRLYKPGRFAELTADCDVAVIQGHLADEWLTGEPRVPTVIDLYDPWLVEHLHYVDTLGLAPYHRDHASWRLQMGAGDFFLCASAEQRQYYLGFLTALGRVHPLWPSEDPDYENLIAAVPFGIPNDVPAHRPYLPATGNKRLLFGGLYDWYDPWTLVEALPLLKRDDWEVLFIENPNPATTPQKLMGEIRAWAEAQGWLGAKIQIMPWVPAARRYDLFRDVDVMVAPHRPSLETRLSMRTRFLDALAVDLPVVATEGGTISRLLREYGAGRVAPAGDPAALAHALDDLLTDEAAAALGPGIKRLRQTMTWDAVLQPLIRFCREPRRDDTKNRFSPASADRSAPHGRWRAMARRLRARLPGRGGS